MKIKLTLGILFVFGALFLGTQSEAYVFGIKSWDNTISNIQQIEETYKLNLPMVSFIFDPWGLHVEHMMNRFNDELGKDRIYHITLSPNLYSAKQVAEGIFDNEYRQFFKDIKKNDLRVVFRTMHEMNGGRYPRSSSPYRFKKAWIHVWDISREEGLSQSNILFDMSVNARDMPIKTGKPSQNGVFVHCTPSAKAKTKCATFEDYYPGAKYVDIMGVTFYNRGKGNSNRRRGTPDQLVNTPGWNSLDRLKKFNKPIFIDEVGTTAVNYTGAYDFTTSLEVYEKNSELKNARLVQLKDFLLRESSIVGAIYFNVDYTDGLKNWTIGEADWSVIDFRTNKFYTGILEVYEGGKPNIYSSLYYLFNVQRVTLNNKTHLVKSQYARPVKNLYAEMNKYSSNTSTQLSKLDTIKSTASLASTYKRFTTAELDAIVDATKSFLE